MQCQGEAEENENKKPDQEALRAPRRARSVEQWIRIFGGLTMSRFSCRRYFHPYLFSRGDRLREGNQIDQGHVAKRFPSTPYTPCLPNPHLRPNPRLHFPQFSKSLSSYLGCHPHAQGRGQHQLDPWKCHYGEM